MIPTKLEGWENSTVDIHQGARSGFGQSAQWRQVWLVGLEEVVNIVLAESSG